MTIPWETVHIFISSTFNDMHAERDYLVKRVFPELREWCEKRKLRLVDIDLRWGVTEQDATSQNVVKVCLDRIDDCRPFFLCFLGQRRGWVPKQEEISPATKAEFPALKEYAGKASVTEIEILHALVNPLHRGRLRDPKKPDELYESSKYAFFYLRDNTYLDQLLHDPPQLRQTYTNEGVENKDERELHEKQLEQWRREKIPATGRTVRSYQAQWNPSLSTPELLLPLKSPSQEAKSVQRWQEQWEKAEVTVTGLDVEADPTQAQKGRDFNRKLTTGRLANFLVGAQPLSQVIVTDLQEAIAARYPEHTELVGETDLQKELDQQEQFLYSGSQGFIERKGDFDELDAYVNNDSNQIFVLTAPAAWVNPACWQPGWTATAPIEGEPFHPLSLYWPERPFHHSLFAPAPATARDQGNGWRILKEEIPRPSELRPGTAQTAGSRGEEGQDRHCAGCAQSIGIRPSDLAWLPYHLPENIKLIISFKRGEPEADNLLVRMQGQAVLSEVKPFENLEHRRTGQ